MMGNLIIDKVIGDAISKDNLTMNEFATLAKKVTNHGALVKAFRSHPNIDFEFIEISVPRKHFKVSRPTE